MARIAKNLTAKGAKKKRKGHKEIMHYLNLFFIALIFVSCEKKTDWELQQVDDDRLVVNAILTNEFKPQRVEISYINQTLNDSFHGISGAIVTILAGDSNYILSEKAPGIYETDSIAAVSGVTYRLDILYQNKNISATAFMLPVALFPPIELVKNENGLYHIKDGNKTFDGELAMYEYDINWTTVAGFDSLNGNTAKKALTYRYNFNKLSTDEIFAPNKVPVRFPSGSTLIEKKYSLTPEHADYLRALLAETEWKGGFFDAPRTNLPTNLSDGGLGYFGACSVVSHQRIVP